MPGRDCVLECGPDKTCYPETCCADQKKGKKGDVELTSVATARPPSYESSIRQRTNGSGSGGAATATPGVKQPPSVSSEVESSGEPMHEDDPLVVETTSAV